MDFNLPFLLSALLDLGQEVFRSLLRRTSMPGGMEAFIPVIKNYFYLFVTAPIALLSFVAYLLGFLMIFIIILLTGQWSATWGRFAIALELITVVLFFYYLFRWISRRSDLIDLRRLNKRKNDIFRFGGKAAVLGMLINAGEKVPTGYALSADVCPSDESKRQQAAAKVARKVARKLPGQTIIVRSSFRFEDSTQATYAGVFLSVPDLSANDENAVAAALQKVWQSADALAPELFPSGSADIKNEASGLSAIFQRQVAVELAGFAFSVDVTTGRRECRMIEITTGAQATVLSHRLTGKRETLLGDAAALTDELARQIEDLTDRISAHFADPVEIEWGWDGNELFLFQARAMSHLPDVQTWVLRPEIGLDLPLTPMSWSVLGGKESIASWLDSPVDQLPAKNSDEFIRLINGRVYFSWFKLTGRQAGNVSLSRLLRVFLSRSGKVKDVDLGDAKPFNELVDTLCEEIQRQHEDHFRADSIAAWVEVLTDREIAASQMPTLFPLGADNPLIQIGLDLGRRMSPQNENELAAQYGYLTQVEMELAEPRAAEDPEILADFALPNAAPVAESGWAQVADTLARKMSHATFRWLPWVVKRLGRQYRKNRLRAEQRHVNILKLNHLLRRAVLAQADKLNFKDTADVFFLSVDELLRGEANAERIQLRKKQYKAEVGADDQFVVHMKDGQSIELPVALSVAKEENAWSGIGLGEGIVSGHLHSPDESGSLPEDAVILVPNTQTRWLRLLTLKRPIVALSGGVLSHLAIVARELNIPLFILDTASGEDLSVGMKVEIDFSQRRLRCV